MRKLKDSSEDIMGAGDIMPPRPIFTTPAPLTTVVIVRATAIVKKRYTQVLPATVTKMVHVGPSGRIVPSPSSGGAFKKDGKMRGVYRGEQYSDTDEFYDSDELDFVKRAGIGKRKGLKHQMGKV